MTEEMMNLRALLEKAPDADILREMIGFAAKRLMAFLRKLKRRGLRGVRLVISDAHEGIKAAATRVLKATWQRCRVHFMRNVLAHAGKSGRRVVSSLHRHRLRPGRCTSRQRPMAESGRPATPQTAQACRSDGRGRTGRAGLLTFPAAHRPKLHSTNPIER